MDRITKIAVGAKNVEYIYDEYGQLEKEVNNVLDKTIEYEYNGIGNLLSVTVDGTTTQFGYSDAYPDRLTSFGGKTITYDALGYPTSYDGKTLTWTKGKLGGFTRGSMSQPGSLYESFTSNYDALGRRTSKNYVYDPNPASTSDYSYSFNTLYTYDNNGRLIRENCTERYVSGSEPTWELAYLYDESGIVGCVHTVNNTTTNVYYYRRNLQGDVVGIYKANGELVTEYAYDAYGNCTIKQGANKEISKVNPIRYRGYYLDRETNLYYLNARYYNPEWRRFLSPDDSLYLDPQNVNGLNLYCYCGNDPVNYADPSGHAPQWLQVAGLIGLGVGLLLCGIAIGILTGGVGTATFIGAVAVGAAKGTLIGAAIGLGTGAISGGIGALAAGEEFGSSGFWSDVAFATMLGFGAGAVVGAIVGGFSGANGWYNAKALEFTNYGSNEVVLGRSPGYVEIAKSRGATYFHTTDDVWNATQSMRGVGTKGMWRINKAFLKQQIKAGAHFTLADPSGGFFYAKEVAYVTKYGVCVYL